MALPGFLNLGNTMYADDTRLMADTKKIGTRRLGSIGKRGERLAIRR